MKLCGINISCHHLNDLLTINNGLKQVITVNAEAIVRAQDDKELANIINNNVSTIDGQIPLWLYKHKYNLKNNEIEKISGSDLIYDVCSWAKKENKSIFLFGGNTEANKEAEQKLREKYDIRIGGFSPAYMPYPFPKEENEKLLHVIKEFAPDVLFVAFGMGKQEYWINDNRKQLEEYGVKIAVGCGGTFDFVSGKIKRAPIFIQKIGMEGIWRLLMEPKLFRFKRILKSFKIFYYYHTNK